ncbi:MAG TPA: HAD hydrolase-like protein [Steroidobacteraceae bacterium]|nr:HAD hydrolase-like protein [Steroidobacteraceae bacterium]
MSSALAEETIAESEPLGPIGGYMFDVDGTLLLSDRSLGGYEMLPGAIEVLSTLKAQGVPFVLLTNGSAYPPAEQAAKLRKAGLPVEDHQMLTPSSITADHMVRRKIRRALVLGTRGVAAALADAGIDTVFPGEPRAAEVDAVYVGWHPEGCMKDIEIACEAVWQGAKLYVASDVPFFITKHGRTIGYSFTLCGAIRRLTKARSILTGKPSLHALRYVAKKLGVPVERVAVVGDDPIVEIVMARRGGAMAFGVTTGMMKREDWLRQAPLRRPHRILADLREVLSAAPIDLAPKP